MKKLSLLLITFYTFLASAQKTNSIKSEFYLVDLTGKKISKTYDFISEFNDKDFAIYSIGTPKKYGIINREGKIILEPKYDEINFEFWNTEYNLIPVKKNTKWGFISKLGIEVIEPTCDSYDFPWNENYFWVNKNNLQALYSLDGKLLSKWYDELYNVGDCFFARLQDKYHVINKRGEVINKLNYLNINYLTSESYKATDKYGKIAIIDKFGNKLIQNTYDQVKSVSYKYEHVGYIVSKNGLSGYLDSDFNSLIPIQYNSLETLEMNDELYFSFSIKDKFGIINETGKVICPEKYDNIKIFSGKYFVTETKGKKIDDYNFAVDIEILNNQGKTIIPKGTFSDYNIPYSSDVLILEKKNKWGVFNNKLLEIIPFNYSSIEFNDNFLIVGIGERQDYYSFENNGGLFGAYTKKGKCILKEEFEKISIGGDYTDKKFIIKKNSLVGIADLSGNITLDPQFEELTSDNEIGICVKYFEKEAKNQFGLISISNSKIILKPSYDYIEPLGYSGKYFVVQKSSKFGVIDSSGKISLPFKFDFFADLFITDQLDFVKFNCYGEITEGYFGNEVKGGKWGLISLSGDTLVKPDYKKIDYFNDSIFVLTTFNDEVVFFNINTKKEIFKKPGNGFSDLGNWDNHYIMYGEAAWDDFYGGQNYGNVGLCDIYGNSIIPKEYASLDYQKGYFIAKSLDLIGYNLLDTKGKLLMKDYEYIVMINDSIAAYLNKTKGNLMNLNNGNNLLSSDITSFDFPESYYDLTFIGIKNNQNLWGLCSYTGEILIKPEYDDLKSNNTPSIIVAKRKENGELAYGVINAENQILIPLEYTEINEDYNGIFDCIKDGMLYKINLSNMIFSKEKYIKY